MSMKTLRTLGPRWSILGSILGHLSIYTNSPRSVLGGGGGGQRGGAIVGTLPGCGTCWDWIVGRKVPMEGGSGPVESPCPKPVLIGWSYRCSNSIADEKEGWWDC